MNEERQHGGELEKSPVWDLLAAYAASHPVNPSPWFVTRAVAQARSNGQQRSGSLFFRWLMPLPLAGLAALAFLTLHGLGIHGLGKSGTYVSSDSEFEAHMELMSTSLD
jgi:hypothetical protein